MLAFGRHGFCLRFPRLQIGFSRIYYQARAKNLGKCQAASPVPHILHNCMKFLDVPRSGSYQGVTSSRNRFGQYLRTRATPVNPASSFQTAVRSRLSTNAQNWRDLTALQKEGWASLGDQVQRTDSLGQFYTLTGFAAYCMVNNNKLAAGDATIADAIAYLPPDPVTSITPTLTAAAFSIAYTPTPLGTGVRAFISCSPQRSPGRSYEGDLRLVSVTAAAAASPANIFSAYTARFGTPIVGNRIFIAVQTYLTGFLSTSLITSATVT